MPRVAAEANAILPSRPSIPNFRAPSDADTKDASPFADLLDSPAPAPEPAPAPRQTRSDRPDRPDRADQPKSADRNDKSNTEARPANDSSDANDSRAADKADDAKSSQDAKDAKDAKSSSDATKDAKGTKEAKDPKAAAAGDKSKSDADLAAALDATLVDGAIPPVVAPQAVAAAVTPQLTLAAAVSAPTEGGTPEADALAALQAAAAGQGPRVGADTTKPGPTQAGNKPADAAAKGEATAGAQAAVPEIEAGKNGEAKGKGSGDKAFSEFHRAAAELLAKTDGNAPAPSAGDAASAIKASVDAVQNLGVAAPANTAAPATAAAATAAAASAAQAQAPAVAVPLSGLPVEIVTHADAGRNHFEIRLDPPDLGRINVKLDVDGNGNVTTHLVVDRADTLDLLKRDASSLERALQQAGLKTSDNALDFSLRQHSFAQDDTPGQSGTQQMVVPDDDPAPLEALRQGYGRLLGLSGGLDIRV